MSRPLRSRCRRRGRCRARRFPAIRLRRRRLVSRASLHPGTPDYSPSSTSSTSSSSSAASSSSNSSSSSPATFTSSSGARPISSFSSGSSRFRWSAIRRLLASTWFGVHASKGNTSEALLINDDGGLRLERHHILFSKEVRILFVEKLDGGELEGVLAVDGAVNRPLQRTIAEAIDVEH